MPVAQPRRPRERGTVTNWVREDYGFVKREGRSSDDIQLHVSNAKGEKFKKHLKRHGLAPGIRVKFVVDFEENRGRPYAAEWEMCEPPEFSDSSASRSRGRGGGRGKRSPSYGRSGKRSPSRRRRSPSRRRRSPT